MRKIAEQIIQEFFIRRAFRKYKGSLPIKSDLENPKFEYHVLADGIVWEDEGIEKCNPKLENALRYVINYRTNLIANKESKIKSDNSRNIGLRSFEMAKEYFPNWVGFKESRCSYNSEISDKIKRIRKVSERKIEDTFDFKET